MENNHLDEALIGIRKIMRAIEINSLSLAKKSRLTPTQHIVLQLISNNETTTQSNISKITTLRHTTIATVINSLHSRELITKQKGITDKRTQHLYITTKGIDILKSSPDILQDQFTDKFNDLEDWEQAMIVSSLQRVSYFVDGANIDAAPIIDFGSLNETPQENKEL